MGDSNKTKRWAGRFKDKHLSYIALEKFVTSYKNHEKNTSTSAVIGRG